LFNQTLGKIITPKIAPIISKWTDKRVDKILEKINLKDAKLGNISLLRKYLTERVLHTLLFNITLGELVKQLNLAVLSQTVGAGIEQAAKTTVIYGTQALNTELSAVGLEGVTLQNVLESTVKSIENAVHQVTTELNLMAQEAYDYLKLPQLIFQNERSETFSALNSLFWQTSTEESVKTNEDILIDQMKYTSNSALDQLFAPKSLTNQTQIYGPAPDSFEDYQIRFKRDFPNFAKLIEFAPTKMTGIGWMFVTENVNKVLSAYQKGKFIGQTATFTSVAMQQGDPDIVTETGAQILNTLDQLEYYIGLDNILNKTKFSVEETAMAMVGYHPVLSRGDAIDKVLLGDEIHSYFENTFGIGMSESITGLTEALLKDMES
jgi:hypothetical protein